MAGAGAEAEAGAKNKGERWSRKLIIYTDFNTFSWGVQGRRRKMCRGRGSNSSVRGHLGPLLISELEPE